MATFFPDPGMWKHFDSAPDPRYIPAFEEMSDNLGRNEKRAKKESWKKIKYRIKLATEGVDQEALAIGILLTHQDWSMGRIADTVGVHRGTLNRWEQFRRIQKTLLALAK